MTSKIRCMAERLKRGRAERRARLRQNGEGGERERNIAPQYRTNNWHLQDHNRSVIHSEEEMVFCACLTIHEICTPLPAGFECSITSIANAHPPAATTLSFVLVRIRIATKKWAPLYYQYARTATAVPAAVRRRAEYTLAALLLWELLPPSGTWGTHLTPIAPTLHTHL